MDPLQESIKQLYQTFECYRKPSVIDGCPCCLDDDDIHSLLHGELKDIPEADL